LIGTPLRKCSPKEGQEPDPPDGPQFAIEDIGSDYIGDGDEDDEDDQRIDVEDPNLPF